jgi:hypothetical protein
MTAMSCTLSAFPIQTENAVNLPDQMIRRHHLVEIERVKELTLSALSPPHHQPLPANRSADPRNQGSTAVSTRVLQHYRPKAIEFAARQQNDAMARREGAENAWDG